MNTSPATVLFVDDEERILRSLRMLFRGRYDVLMTTSGQEALQIVRSRPVHALISDQRMPEMLGVDLLRQARLASPATMRLLLTGYSDLQAIVSSVNDGEIFRFIEKPWQAQHLIDTVAQAVQIAQHEFALPRVLAEAPTSIAVAAATATDARLLVLDEDGDTLALVHEIVGTTCHVQGVATVEAALELLCEGETSVVIAELAHRTDNVAGALKTLKRYNPATLTIAISHLRDSRTLIELINQGQVYRFLPKPLSRELLKRSLQAALSHFQKLKVAPALLRRHAVEEAKFEPMSLSSRLLDYWRRIRDNGRTRPSA